MFCVKLWSKSNHDLRR